MNIVDTARRVTQNHTDGEYPSASGENADERPCFDATPEATAHPKGAGVKCVASEPTIATSESSCRRVCIPVVFNIEEYRQ